MKKEAEAHAEEDRKNKEVIEARNHADNLISMSERTLKDAGDKVSAEDKKSVEDKIAALKEVKDKNDLEALKKATDELSNTIQKVGAAMYQQAGAAGQAGQPGPDAKANPGAQPGAEQGPVDAEFTEKK
jgi:molecular chaperone DnaK